MKRGLVMFAAVSLSAPTIAQLAPGYSGTSDAPTEASQDEYWGFVAELGRCFAKTKYTKAVKFLDTTPGTPDEQRAFGQLLDRNGHNSCMQDMVQATVVRGQVRGAIAESIVKAGVGTLPAGTAHGDLSGPGEITSLDDFADCYVSTHRGEAMSLLAETRLGTRDERVRVRKLATDFGPCLPQGREIRLAPTNVRLALASALYRAMVKQSAMRGTN